MDKQRGIFGRGMRLVWRYVRAEPVTYVLSLVGATIYAGAAVGTTVVLGRVTDDVIIPAFTSGVALPAEKTGRHIFNQFVIRHPRRDAVREYLQSNGIGSEIYYPEPLHLLPCFASLGYSSGMMPASERASRESLALPIYPELTPEMIQRVAAAVMRV